VDFGWGQEGPPSEPPPRNFQIPSQPLAIALEAFARESGIEVLYESSIVASLQSTSVEGAYTPEMALQTLLSRTELRVRYARENAKTLSLPGSDDRWSVSGRSRRDGRATGTEATRLICEYGFFFFRNLRSIKVEVHEYNRAAQRVYERIGFKLVGRLRGASLLNNRRYDEIVMDLLHSELMQSHVGRFEALEREGS
jgi:Acetyltransferase (GNAT) domain